MSITKPHLSVRSRKLAAGAAVAAVLGGVVAGCGSSDATTGTASAAGVPTGAPQGGQPPGLGTEATGTAASKAKAAALAKYPGTVERVMQLSDGSYVVHVIAGSGGEVHVLVSKAFAVTGTEQGMPGGGTPPSGTTPPTTGSSTTQQ